MVVSNLISAGSNAVETVEINLVLAWMLIAIKHWTRILPAVTLRVPRSFF
jgi:hypothetical protein